MLTAKEQLIDLGVIQYGKIYEFEYDISNSLDKNMKIDKVSVSCSSCTKATLPSKIKGKETVKMKVTYTPGLTGATSKWIDIRYDDDQVLRVNFKAIVNE